MLIDDLKNGEGDQLELKLVPNRDSAKWLKTVVAFANGRGGRIVFGVSNDRRAVGLEGDLFATKDGIADAIANAVAHRSYVNGEESPITVALYDDRLEVTSPGKLPHGVSVTKMREGCSECRNKALAQALAYMNVIEDWGSGIPRVREDLASVGLQDLDICEWPNAVRMVIHRRLPPNHGGDNGGKGKGSEHSDRIIELMRKNPKISVSAIVSAIGGGKRSIEREIAALKAAGRVARKGTYAGRWTVLGA